MRFLFGLLLLAAAAAEIPSSVKVSAAIKNRVVQGVEDLDFKFAVPFHVKDYLVGFRYTLGNLKKAPESLFARKSFDTPADGVATVEADYNIASNNLNVATNWVSDKLGLTVGAVGDVQSRLKSVSLSKSFTVNQHKISLATAYDVLKSKLAASLNAKIDANNVKLDYDTVTKDPLLTVSREIDSANELTPSISLKTGDVVYGYKRKWEGGSLLTKLTPGEKVAFTWTDKGSNGKWTTNAEVPFSDTTKSKVSFSHDWDY